VVTCPRKLLVGEGDEIRAVNDLSLCIQCAHCVAVCEPEALTHSAVPPDAAPAAGEVNLTDDQLEQFLRRRRSIRRFKSDAVEPDKLDRLFDIARYAPTGKNRQGVHHTVVTGERILQLERATAGFYRTLIRRLASPVGRLLIRLAAGPKTLGDLIWGLPDLKRDVARVERGRPTYCHGAPVVVVLHGEPSSTMAEDCSFAVYHLMMAAETLGLGTCLIGYVKAAADREQPPRDVCDLPAGHQVYSVVAIGYPAETFVKLVPRRPANVRRLD
jgi:nitroreductase